MGHKTKTVVEYFDDMTGETVSGDELHRQKFSVGGKQYELEGTQETIAAFLEVVRPYTEKAKKVPARTRQGGPSNSEVRAWCKRTGVEVSERGRIPQDIIDQYLAAH